MRCPGAVFESLSRVWALFRRALDEEFDSEVAAHISLLAERFERQGMTSDERVMQQDASSEE